MTTTKIQSFAEHDMFENFQPGEILEHAVFSVAWYAVVTRVEGNLYWLFDINGSLLKNNAHFDWTTPFHMDRCIWIRV